MEKRSYYECPVCEKEMKRELLMFLNHANQHIIEAIKQEHPEWVSSDGVCGKCMEYYKKQLAGSE